MSSPRSDQRTLVIISQTFVPDPASVGQHMADVAREMARRGHRVVVYTSNRGYENPGLRYPSRENLDGVDVRRLPFSSFGKRSIPVRAFGTFTFLVQCVLICLFTPRLGGIFFSTSPPMIGAAAAIVRMIRRVPIVYWAMDLNPDQLIAMKKIKAGGFVARILERVNRFYLRRSSLVVALDRFMAARLRARGVSDGRLIVLPPWSHEDHMAIPGDDDRAANPFRARHGLCGKFVVMYSGNHSPANPLDTLLAAATRLRGDPDVRFAFVGGGLAKRDVEAAVERHGLGNVLLLPYQPLAALGHSLGAADVHVVSLGEPMVGIIHPCKVYGAMAVARPILYLGPAPSHVSDLLQKHGIGWHVAHGDVDGVVRAIAAARRMAGAELAAMGARARRALRDGLGQAMLCGQMCDHVDRVFRSGDAGAAAGAAAAVIRTEPGVTCVR
jgi:colanic acid biosynthesis glycosyl transferase WcaI